MDKKDIIKNKMKIFEENIITNKLEREKSIGEIIELIETIDNKDFEINLLYAKAILWKNDDHSLDDAWCILSNIAEGKSDFEWNYLLAKICYQKKIYDEALEYIKDAIKIDDNDKSQKLYKNIIEKIRFDLISNIDKLHTTELGVERIKRNLGLDTIDVVAWCRRSIISAHCSITRKGKNWYVDVNNCQITVNAHSYTIITAHKIKQ